MRSFLFTLLILLPLSASASGMQISPDRLEFVLPIGQEQQKELVVVNPTADVQLFEVSLDDAVGSMSVQPKSFTLESGARKNLTVRVDANGLPSGVSSTNLSVVSRLMSDAQVQVNTGVKIPVTIRTTPIEPRDRSKALGILLAAGIGAAVAMLAWDSQRLSSMRTAMADRFWKTNDVVALEPEPVESEKITPPITLPDADP
ncbi:hypothetical protein HZA86_00165 [Candidatus Uhrbacteria bacterium]|nr:hypothetical protein [Candidatus Uhrbacteria bacterium]